MKPIYNGDRRDRVKWGALVHLARREHIEQLLVILQFRDDTPRLLVSSAANGQVELPTEVWNHFSDLASIADLSAATGIEIHLFERQWANPRAAYFGAALQWLISFATRPRIVFTDPDTGLGGVTDGLCHIRPTELTDLWNALRNGEWLVLYQHAGHNTHWRETKLAEFSTCCPGALQVEQFSAASIANDVMFYAAKHP